MAKAGNLKKWELQAKGKHAPDWAGGTKERIPRLTAVAKAALREAEKAALREAVAQKIERRKRRRQFYDQESGLWD